MSDFKVGLMKLGIGLISSGVSAIVNNAAGVDASATSIPFDGQSGGTFAAKDLLKYLMHGTSKELMHVTADNAGELTVKRAVPWVGSPLAEAMADDEVLTEMEFEHHLTIKGSSISINNENLTNTTPLGSSQEGVVDHAFVSEDDSIEITLELAKHTWDNLKRANAPVQTDETDADYKVMAIGSPAGKLASDFALPAVIYMPASDIKHFFPMLAVVKAPNFDSSDSEQAKLPVTFKSLGFMDPATKKLRYSYIVQPVA